MKTTHLVITLLGLFTVGTLFAADSTKTVSPVKVTFVTPEKFTDVKDDWISSDGYRDQVLGELKAQFESIARTCLAEGQQLEVRVTDVDLAGDFEPGRGLDFNRIRILREIYPPRMELEFRLLGADGKVVREGKRRLQELGYLMSTGFPTSDPLRYDKDLIRSWMRQEFKRSS